MKDGFNEKMWIFFFFGHFMDFYGFFSQIFIITVCERHNIHAFTETYPKQFIAFAMATEKPSLLIRKTAIVSLLTNSHPEL